MPDSGDHAELLSCRCVHASFISRVASAQHGDLGTWGSAYWSESRVAYGTAHKLRF